MAVLRRRVYASQWAGHQLLQQHWQQQRYHQQQQRPYGTGRVAVMGASERGPSSYSPRPALPFLLDRLRSLLRLFVLVAASATGRVASLYRVGMRGSRQAAPTARMLHASIGRTSTRLIPGMHQPACPSTFHPIRLASVRVRAIAFGADAVTWKLPALLHRAGTLCTTIFEHQSVRTRPSSSTKACALVHLGTLPRGPKRRTPHRMAI
ncbi:hypothetical protein OC834_006371 [Tilletia horrida]|nr:hypothetical protein OC834_006371 [Tilletia horrida]